MPLSYWQITCDVRLLCYFAASIFYTAARISSASHRQAVLQCCSLRALVGQSCDCGIVTCPEVDVCARSMLTMPIGPLQLEVMQERWKQEKWQAAAHSALLPATPAPQGPFEESCNQGIPTQVALLKPPRSDTYSQPNFSSVPRLKSLFRMSEARGNCCWCMSAHGPDPVLCVVVCARGGGGGGGGGLCWHYV